MIGPQFPSEVPEEVTAKTLRQFACIGLIVFGGLFAFSYYRHGGKPSAVAWIAVLLSVLFGIPGLIFPALIRPVYIGLLTITRPIGHVVSIVMLGVIYFGLITPLAILFRLIRRDNLVRRRASVDSYWTSKPEPSDVRSYLRQYYEQ
jgi:hypothetical protein